jgi:hypothetical protein
MYACLQQSEAIIHLHIKQVLRADRDLLGSGIEGILGKSDQEGEERPEIGARLLSKHCSRLPEIPLLDLLVGVFVQEGEPGEKPWMGDDSPTPAGELLIAERVRDEAVVRQLPRPELLANRRRFVLA